MIANLLLDEWERILEAPEAMDRIRDLVLRLALRGVLTDQSSESASAIKLVTKATKAGRSFETTLGGVHQRLHRNWLRVPLIALGSWAVGSGFPKNEQGMTQGDYPFLKVSDMNLPGNERRILTANNYVDDAALHRMRARLHPPGTIVFPKIGGAIATNKRRILSAPSAFDNNCLGITFANSLSIEWCFLLMMSLDFAKYQIGTAVPALQQRTLEQIPVDLPPLADQRRIVAKVDELMALCNQLEAAQSDSQFQRDALRTVSLHRLTLPEEEATTRDVQFFLDMSPRLITRSEHVAAMKRSILELAVLGRLVPHEPEDGSGADLVRTIASFRRRGGTRDPKPLFESEKPLPLLPSAWIWSSMDEVASVEANAITDGPFGANLKTAHYIAAPGFRVVRLENIGHGFFRSSLTTYITQEHWERLSKHHILAGDLVVAGLVDPSVRACEVPEDIGPALVKADCYRFHVHPEFSSRFALHYLNSPVCQGFASVHHHGMTLTRLGLGNFRCLPIPVPPLAEQERIASKVDELMVVCDELMAALDSAQSERGRLLEALLHEALNECAGPMDLAEAVP